MLWKKLVSEWDTVVWCKTTESSNAQDEKQKVQYTADLSSYGEITREENCLWRPFSFCEMLLEAFAWSSDTRVKKNPRVNIWCQRLVGIVDNVVRYRLWCEWLLWLTRDEILIRVQDETTASNNVTWDIPKYILPAAVVWGKAPRMITSKGQWLRWITCYL